MASNTQPTQISKTPNPKSSTRRPKPANREGKGGAPSTVQEALGAQRFATYSAHLAEIANKLGPVVGEEFWRAVSTDMDARIWFARNFMDLIDAGRGNELWHTLTQPYTGADVTKVAVKRLKDLINTPAPRRPADWNRAFDQIVAALN